jgi:acyl-CoA synthetase (AMP-forming)/AMP-acid ligase II
VTGLVHPGARLVDAATGAVVAGADLSDRVDAAAEAYGRLPAGAAFALMPTETPAVLRLLGALAGGRPVAPLDPTLPDATLRAMVARFRPAIVTGVSGRDDPPDGYRAEQPARLGAAWLRQDPPEWIPHRDLALLLTTSGSTGNPKLVRLSRTAVVANADSIATALGVEGDEVAPTTLPLFYTYGLSVLTSHLRRGATVVLERSGLTSREFWRAVDEHGATSMAAVPYQYEILHRLRLDPGRYPRLRTLTQAGGRLRPELIADFHARMAAVGGRMFVMYGQTEATARMTVLPPDCLPARLGSVGLPVPGGTVAVDPETDEVVYRGPNVMMGYAETAADLARGDDLGGVLATGDRGRLDEDGFLFITGRLKRMAKVFGVRVDLDDIERMVAHHGPVAAVAGDDRLLVYVESNDAEAAAKLRAELAAGIGTHSSGVDVQPVAALPLTPAGKIDYRTLEGASWPGPSR